MSSIWFDYILEAHAEEHLASGVLMCIPVYLGNLCPLLPRAVYLKSCPKTTWTGRDFNQINSHSPSLWLFWVPSIGFPLAKISQLNGVRPPPETSALVTAEASLSWDYTMNRHSINLFTGIPAAVRFFVWKMEYISKSIPMDINRQIFAFLMQICVLYCSLSSQHKSGHSTGIYGKVIGAWLLSCSFPRNEKPDTIE